MTISATQFNGIKIINPQGNIDFIPGADMQTWLDWVGADGSVNTIVNLNGVPEFTLPLINSLVRIFGLCRRRGNKFALVDSFNNSGALLLESTGLSKIMPRTKTVDEAIALMSN
ncbi:hypothetical protein ISS30_03000 [bacterium]|nr:hypothetical protein [bacterium]